MKLPEKIAAITTAFFDRNIAPEKLFAAVLACFPAFLLQRNITVLAAESAAFMLLCLLRRGKIRLLNPLLIFAFVTLCNLFPPYGKVIAHIAYRTLSLTITQGALAQGIRKAEILVGMVWLSQFALSPRLSLPGRAGVFLARMFAAFDRIAASPLPAKRAPFSLTRFLTAIDERLCAAYAAGNAGDTTELPQPPASPPHTTPAGWTFLLLLPLSMYSTLIANI
jgi:hypothetical protein